jgi:aldose 1-epimerase
MYSVHNKGGNNHMRAERLEANNRPFMARVEFDRQLDSTVISLSYKDAENPSRSIEVGIAPDLGSNMFRFRVGEHDLIYCEPDLLRQKDFTGNFVLWPLPNRIRDKQYVYQGQSYSLAELKRPRGNDVLIHGLVFDRQWQYEPPVVGQDAVSVKTSVEITPQSPFYRGYPFESRLSLTYTLTKNGVSITYTVQNNGSQDMPFGFALHPYFSALAGRDDTLISIPANTVMEADDDLLPTGRLLDVRGIMYAMFDLRQPVPISHLKLDHVYTDLQKNESALIEYRKQAMRLRISASEDFTHVVIYTPPDEPFFCLEHQTCSTDAVNLAHQGLGKIAHLLELHPGETGTGFLQYTVEYEAHT